MVVLLVDVAVEHGGVLVRHQELDRLDAVARRPVPVGLEVEQRPVRQHDDRLRLVELLEVGGQPGELRLAEAAGRIRDVVERDEVHALVVEGVVRLAEELLVGLALVERGVMLAGDEAHGLDLELLDDVAELGEALAALLRVVGRVGQIAGEDDEVGLLRQRVDPGDRLLQRAAGVGVGLVALEPPMAVGQLDEMEILLDPGGLGAFADPEARGEHHAAKPGEG